MGGARNDYELLLSLLLLLLLLRIGSNADLRHPYGFLPVSSISLHLFPIFNCTFINTSLHTDKTSVFWSPS